MEVTVSKDTVKRAAQLLGWDNIYSHLGVDVAVNGKGKHQFCPACGGKDRFRYDDRTGNGDYICAQCGADDGINLLMKVFGWSFPETLKQVASIVGPSLVGEGSAPPVRREPAQPPAPTYTKDNPDHEAAATLTKITTLTQLPDIQQPGNIIVLNYLQRRGLSLTAVPGGIYYAMLHESETRKAVPCMVAPVRYIDGEIRGYQRTYLTADGSGKANIEHPKKLTSSLYDGAYRGCSVWLGKPGDTLHVCEGIETGLAVQEILATQGITGQPVWCALSASMMKNIVLPEHTRTVEIWADNDTNQTGQKAAAILATRLRSEGRNGFVNTPDAAGDWLDVLTQQKGVAA